MATKGPMPAGEGCGGVRRPRALHGHARRAAAAAAAASRAAVLLGDGAGALTGNAKEDGEPGHELGASEVDHDDSRQQHEADREPGIGAKLDVHQTRKVVDEEDGVEAALQMGGAAPR